MEDHLACREENGALCMQLMKARAKLQETCASLLQQARERKESAARSAGSKPVRGLAPGSFMEHMAESKHRADVKDGCAFSDTEIIQQVCAMPSGEARFETFHLIS